MILFKKKILKSAGILALCMSVSASGISAVTPVRADAAGKIQKMVRFKPDQKKKQVMMAGDTTTFQVKVSPKKLSSSAKIILVKSSNVKTVKPLKSKITVSAEGIASVKVKAVKKGSCTLKFCAKKGGKQAIYKITVKENKAAESISKEETENLFAGGSGTAEAPYQIETAVQLDQVRNHLTAHYILMKDIDLSGYKNWEPIGRFKSRSDKPEDAELPKEEVAFRGSFDGNGHMISGLHVDQPQGMAVGLFGCALGTESNPGFLKNLTLKNVEISGAFLVGGAVGLQFMNFVVDGVVLEGTNYLSGMQGIGGIVGTGFDWIRNCSATADITVLGDGGACAGLIAGGTTYSSIENCSAQDGTITAEGNQCWGFGGVCGAPYAANVIRDCTSKNIKISITGEKNRLIGGIAGFAGAYDGEVAAVENCMVENAEITVSDTTRCVGGVVGGPKEITEGSDQMSVFTVKKCSVSGKIFGGSEKIGSIIGDEANTEITDCTGKMEIPA